MFHFKLSHYSNSSHLLFDKYTLNIYHKKGPSVGTFGKGPLLHIFLHPSPFPHFLSALYCTH